MCTAVSKNNYFGRNLDLDRSYGERVVITPRNFEFKLRHKSPIRLKYALIGMATVIDNFPLYFEATNEKGLSIASLNFPNNAHYNEVTESEDNICQFELVPYLLSECESVQEVKKLLENINITNTPFSGELPPSPLHWIIADKDSAITVESVMDGIHIYENKVGVLTNNPPFTKHIENLKKYENLTNICPEGIPDSEFCLGLGALGLPGDFSSPSRFVKAAFVSKFTEIESIDNFFDILSSVAMPKGCVLDKNGQSEHTLYSCAVDTDKCIYYYKTYKDRNMHKVGMFSANLDGKELYIY